MSGDPAHRRGTRRAARAPEVNVAVIDSARSVAPRRGSTIEVSATRARFVLTGGGFVLPQGTELRARLDRYGHLLLWPGERHVSRRGARLAAGAARRAQARRRARRARRGRRRRRGAAAAQSATRRVEVSTRAAKATLELATLHDVDDGGLPRVPLLLDLMSASPCDGGLRDRRDAPARRASLDDAGGARVRRVSIVRRGGSRRPGPGSASGVARPSRRRRRRNPRRASWFRGASSPRFGPRPSRSRCRRRREARPVGLTLLNSTDELRMAWLDGVPAAWVAPGARLVLPRCCAGATSCSGERSSATPGSRPRPSSPRARARPAAPHAPSLSPRRSRSRAQPRWPSRGPQRARGPGRALARTRPVDRVRSIVWRVLAARTRRSPARPGHEVEASRCARPRRPRGRRALRRAGKRPSRRARTRWR